ncbi:MAG: ATP-binding protein [Saprospiraceae bacterium]
MHLENSNSYKPIKVRETQILSTDTRQQYREKIARITLDSMVQFVGLLDTKGTVLEINHVALDAVGINLSDVEGKPFWDTFWWQVSDEINIDLRKFIGRAALGELVRWDVEIYGRAGGTETIIIDASLCPVKDEHGEVVFIAAEGRDISEKKKYELEIAQKNIELQGLLERIRELDEIKTQFFANVSHELRTPLALIIGPAERLINQSTLSPEVQNETAQVIVRNAKMLLKHVNDLLDISKLEAGKLKINLEETDIPELIRFVASHFDVLVLEKHLDFRIETGPSYLSLVDPEKLQRIIMNLLSNAFKFVPTGGIVRCKLETPGKEVILTIEDSGPGVKPELRKYIFERFRQGDGASSRHFAGTGLGLSIVFEFVSMHRGTIEVSDSELGGALFKIKLPVPNLLFSSDQINSDETVRSTYNQVIQSTMEGLVEELRLNDPIQPVGEFTPNDEMKTRVLIVEDNPEMNKFISQSLSNEYQVITAYDGQEGIQKAILFSPDLIVSDIMMPGMSGVEMINELRKRPEMADIPILMVSAKADEELKYKLLDESVQDFITKPFSERDLQVRIRNLLAVKKSRDILQYAERSKQEAVEAINRDLMSQTKQLSDLFEQTPSFMAVLRGPNHIFEFSNTSFYKLVGNRPLIDRAAREAFPEIAGQGFFELLDHVLASGEIFKGTSLPVLLDRERKIHLEQRYVDFVFQPLLGPDGSVTGIFIEGHDVTEEVNTKKQLIENEEKLNIVINASELGTWELNLKTREVKYNDRYINLLGHESGVELTHEQIVKQIHPDDIPVRERAFDEAFITGILHYESRIVWNDGAIHWIEGRGKLFYDAENNPDKLIGTVREITNEKNYEAELLKNEKKLDELVKERTFQLARSNEDLQRFAHVASHDLKEPIRKIKTFSTLIQDEYHHLLPEKGNVFLNKILNATDRVYSMIDGVLSYSSITTEEHPTSRVDLNAILKNIESDLEILIEEKKATLVIGELPTIEGVPVLLYQLFYNLVNNSIKFSKSNEPPRIHIMSSMDKVDDKPFSKIVLRDNGIGFAPEQAEKIFTTFARLNRKDKYEGTGLGLALCKKIVQRHDGHIFARGETNIGAEFTILLPFN